MQTVSFAGSSYNIPNTRGDRPWSGLSDFVIAAASKAINTAGGNFTLLADINFGATFGLVSTYYKSRTANVASAGQIRLANADTIKFRNTLNDGNLSVGITTNRLTFEGSRLLIASAAEIVNADINASAAIALTKLAALSASIVPVANASGFLTSSAVTATELGYVSGVTSAIQTQLTAKAPSASPTFTGTVTLPVTADRALQTGTSSVLEASAVTKTELGYVSGVTSAIQTQITAKAGLVSPSFTTPVLGVASATSLSFSSTSGIIGTTTNNNAAAGSVGEYIESVFSAQAAPTSSTYTDIANVSLTAGDWDVSVMLNINAGTSATQIIAGITATSGAVSTGLVVGQNSSFIASSAVAQLTAVVPVYRISLAGTTTYYLKGNITYTGGGSQVNGRISARRVR